MRQAWSKYLYLISMTVIAHNGFSQFGGSNIFEFQAGNLPYDTPDFLYTNYDQLNLQYRYKDFKVSGRMEYFINKNPEQRYVNLSQYQFRYSKKQFDIKAGHFYEMLGNGLLLRAYDIPAAIF